MVSGYGVTQIKYCHIGDQLKWSTRATQLMWIVIESESLILWYIDGNRCTHTFVFVLITSYFVSSQ